MNKLEQHAFEWLGEQRDVGISRIAQHDWRVCVGQRTFVRAHLADAVCDAYDELYASVARRQMRESE